MSTMAKTTVNGQEYPFIDVYQSIGGWKAVMIWWNPEMGGFPEPYQTGSGAYATEEEAWEEATVWADAEDLPLNTAHLQGKDG